MSEKHTPWDYEIHTLSEGISAIVYDAKNRCVADHLDEDTAVTITEAVNSYASDKAAIRELVEALEKCLPFILRHKFDDNLQKSADALHTEIYASTLIAKHKEK